MGGAFGGAHGADGGAAVGAGGVDGQPAADAESVELVAARQRADRHLGEQPGGEGESREPQSSRCAQHFF